MLYLTDAEAIAAKIAELINAKTLWIDLEMVNYRYQPLRVSLIQVLDQVDSRAGDRSVILDVMDQPTLLNLFVEQIMANPQIEKVFHNAEYDVGFLGRSQAKNITCTWKMAQQIPYYLMPVTNLKLKTLAEELCHFDEIPEGQQRSDWGQRPLTEEQLYYAMMDTVYLAHVHMALLERLEQVKFDPTTADIATLSDRYLQISASAKILNSELAHLEEKLQKAMRAKNLSETEYLKLSSQEQTTAKVDFDELAKFTQEQGIKLEFTLSLPKGIRRSLKHVTDQLQIKVEKVKTWKLTAKHRHAEQEDRSYPPAPSP